MASTVGLSGPRAGDQEATDTDNRETTESTTSRLGTGVVGAAGIGHGEVPRVLSELERLLTEPGCPVCRYVAETERSFFSWFEIESYSSSGVQAQLRASIGMCPAHSRRLIDGVGEGHIMTIVMREALAGARSAVREDTEIGVCAACVAVASGSSRARTLLLDGLQDPALVRLYRKHEGICLVHLLDAVPVAPASTLKQLTERLLDSLNEGAGVALIGLLAGSDADAPRRAIWRERLPEPAAVDSTVEGLSDRLQIDACPVCLAAGVAGRDYLRWFVARSAEGDRSLGNDPGEFCDTHLHDVALADPVVASNHVAGHKRAARVAQLELFLARLAASPTPPRRGRRATSDALDDARRHLLASPYCAPCHAREGIERAQHELIGAALGLAAVRERYERSHGLCVRHVRQLADGPAARFARQHADARLAVIAWEVQETARKYAWAYRHEAGGPERDGWLRGLAQIDGRVLDGGPVPIAEDEDGSPLATGQGRVARRDETSGGGDDGSG